MNVYNQIINPNTGRKVNISGKIGKQILKNYVQVLNNSQSGGEPETPSWKKKVKRAMFKIKIINGWSKLVKSKLYQIDSEILDSIEEKYLAISNNSSRFINKSVYDVFDNIELSWVKAISKKLYVEYTDNPKL